MTSIFESHRFFVYSKVSSPRFPRVNGSPLTKCVPSPLVSGFVCGGALQPRIRPALSTHKQEVL